MKVVEKDQKKPIRELIQETPTVTDKEELEEKLREQIVAEKKTVEHGVKRIGEIIVSNGYRVRPRFTLERYEYDYRLSDFPVLIETHEIKADHQSQERQRRSIEKNNVAVKNGYRLLRFRKDEDEETVQKTMYQTTQGLHRKPRLVIQDTRSITRIGWKRLKESVMTFIQ